MSIKTWKKEFYPKKPSRRMSNVDAIKHSIRKWEGLTEGNLKKHEVYLSYHNDYLDDDDDNVFEISSDTCSLCVKYADKSSFNMCENCPLYMKLGRSCGSSEDTNKDNDGWLKWVDEGNPDLMIKNLKSLLDDK